MPTLEKSFLEQEEEIAELAATFGRMVTEQLLEKFDTQGEPLLVQGQRTTRQGQAKKNTLPHTAQ